MTTHKIHISHWHSFKVQFGHLMQNGRFWAVVVLMALILLMIVAGLFSDRSAPMTHFPPYGFPMYPHWP